MNTNHTASLFCFVALLSACGGGSGGTTFDSLANEGNALLTQYQFAEATPLANMPDTGSVTYNGVAAYSSFWSDPADIIYDPDSLSEVQLQADFGSSTISGKAYNFRSYDSNVTVTGQINLTDGTITGNQFSANLSGTLTESGYGITAAGNYTGSLSGEFGGDNAEFVAGTGSATGDYGIYGSVTSNAVFIAD